VGGSTSRHTSPITFLWLIIGYHQQRNELRINTQTLELQKEELNKQVKELTIQNGYQAVIAKSAEEQRLDLPSNKFKNQQYAESFRSKKD